MPAYLDVGDTYRGTNPALATIRDGCLHTITVLEKAITLYGGDPPINMKNGAEPSCETPGCIAGWYGWAQGIALTKECLNNPHEYFGVAANDMSRHWGFKDRADLGKWLNGPGEKLWGYMDGDCIFLRGSAWGIHFIHADEFYVSDAIKHLKGFVTRLEEQINDG